MARGLLFAREANGASINGATTAQKLAFAREALATSVQLRWAKTRAPSGPGHFVFRGGTRPIAARTRAKLQASGTLN
eukprot:5331150-Lingulodinium_polyedra.AAC.1